MVMGPTQEFMHVYRAYNKEQGLGLRVHGHHCPQSIYHMSHSLNSLKGDSVGGDIGDNYGGY